MRFFDSQGWKRVKENPQFPYKKFPKANGSTYMSWESDGFELTLSVKFNPFDSFEKNEPRYYLVIVFDPEPHRWD